MDSIITKMNVFPSIINFNKEKIEYLEEYDHKSKFDTSSFQKV